MGLCSPLNICPRVREETPSETPKSGRCDERLAQLTPLIKMIPRAVFEALKI